MGYIAQRRPLRNPTLLSDNAPNSLEFPRHALINCNYVIERVRNLTGHACPVIWQSRGKVAAFECQKGCEELLGIELVPVESRIVSWPRNGDRGGFLHERLEGCAHVRSREFDAKDSRPHSPAP